MRAEDVWEVLRMLKVNTARTRQSGNEIYTHCLMADWNHARGDRNPSMNIHVDDGVSLVYCHGCKVKGTLYSVVHEVTRRKLAEGTMTKQEADQVLMFIIENEEDDEPWIIADKRPVERAVPEVPEKFLAMLNRPHEYFAKRGLDEFTVYRWKLGYHDNGKRVILPLLDRDGKVLAVQGRLIEDPKPYEKNPPPKYITTPAKFPKSEYLYGMHLFSGMRVLVVTEGPFDALKVDQALQLAPRFRDWRACAIWGSELSETQLRLVREAEEVVLCLDNDPEGKLGTKKALEALRHKTKVFLPMKWPEGKKDMGSMSNIEIHEVLDSRIWETELQIRKGLGLIKSK